MENINIGLINLIVSENFKNNYFTETKLNENVDEKSKILVGDFLSVVKSSPILMTEFKIFNNIENKHIENELAASRYIDNNIKLLEIYTIDEINNERKKIKPFFNENVDLSEYEEKINLYESINCLVLESLKNYDDVDVDKMHESFTFIVNHLKKPKDGDGLDDTIKTIDIENINESIIKIAINKFNEKYSSLPDEDKTLFNFLIESNEKEKENVFEEEKKNVIKILENIDDKSLISKKLMVLEKVKSMKYSKTTINEDMIKLHELKKGLL